MGLTPPPDREKSLSFIFFFFDTFPKYYENNYIKPDTTLINNITTLVKQGKRGNLFQFSAKLINEI